MNRAILIVICDFLVSAMLSMMTGMVPAHTGGTGVGLDERTTRLLLGELELRQKELENLRRQLREAAAQKGINQDSDRAVAKITQELIDNMRRIENVKRAQRANAANTGKLSAADLKKKLEEEARKRLELEIRLRDQKLDAKTASTQLDHTRQLLAQEKERLAKTEKRLTETSEAERSANAELRKLASDYRKVQEKLGNAETNRRLTERELAAARSAIAAREADLSGVKNALREMNSRIGKVSLERQELQRTLAFTTGKLNTAERDNADFKGQLLKLQRMAAQQKLALVEAQRENTQMKQLVKRSLQDLSDAKKESDSNKIAAKLAEGKLAATEKILKQITAKPAAEAFKRYSAAAFNLKFLIREKAMVLERSAKGDYVPVLVQFGNKTLAIAPFELLTGTPGSTLLYRSITHLSYFVSLPDSSIQRPLTEPILAVNTPKGEKLAAFEISLKGRTPLKLVTREELMEKGLENLFLFSFRKFGTSSAPLIGRCSVDPRKDYPYLLIRNSRSRSNNQLNAELGDIIVTRDGGFVGVVTGFDKENQQEAKVLLFSDKNLWQKAVRIPVVHKAGARYADDFGNAVRAFKGVPQQKR